MWSLLMSFLCKIENKNYMKITMQPTENDWKIDKNSCEFKKSFCSHFDRCLCTFFRINRSLFLISCIQH